MCNLFGTLDKKHIHLSSIRVISNAHKIHFGALIKTLFQPLNSNLFSISSSMLISCCAVSRVIKGLEARPPPTCTNQHPHDSILLIFRGFSLISSNIAIEEKGLRCHLYPRLLVRFLSLQLLPPLPTDALILLLAAALSHMHLCCPDLRCLCPPRRCHHSSLATAIPPLAVAPFCRHCQLLSSHSCRFQPLLAFTAPINGWLLSPSLLHHPLPGPLSAAPIIDTFIAGCRAILS